MCAREGMSLQRGMNFPPGNTHSVVLSSLRPNAPYDDRLEEGGTVLIYEGHDEPKNVRTSNPKMVDQPLHTKWGSPTQNGLFHEAAQSHKNGGLPSRRVRVYEKIKAGIWSYNAVFLLVDSWTETSKSRRVYKFRLQAIQEVDDAAPVQPQYAHRRRIIPSGVKLSVWKRDGGKCVQCGAATELHFDHIVPFAKGGTSETPENIQLLCMRHNLQKRDHIR